MIVRYEGKRTFKVWKHGETWCGVETKYIIQGKLAVSYKDCFFGKDVNEIVDRIEESCKIDDLVANGMNRLDAVNLVIFGK